MKKSIAIYLLVFFSLTNLLAGVTWEDDIPTEMCKGYSNLITVIASLELSPVKDSSIFKVKEEKWSTDEGDFHMFEYKPMTLTVLYATIYVFEYENYKKISEAFPVYDAHAMLFTSHGIIKFDNNPIYQMPYREINEGDTVHILRVGVDSMAGSSWIEKYTYIGSKRESSSSMLSQKSTERLNVFPNPVNDKIYIPKIEGVFKYMLYDLQGRAIIGGSGNQNYIDVSILRKGQYILQIRIKEKTYSSKIIKR